MKRRFAIAMTLLLAQTQMVAAYPKLPRDAQGDLFGNPSDQAVQIFQDDVLPDLYYVSPKRVVPVEDPFSKKKLFKLNYSQARNTAELQGVFRVGFDPATIAEEWAAIKRKNPKAMIKQIDMSQGEFGIEMRQEGFSLLIGKGEIVKTDTGVDFPIQIDLNKNGVDILRAQASSGSLAALTLNFAYQANFMDDGKSLSFSTDVQQFVKELQQNKDAKQAWDHTTDLSDMILKRFLYSSFVSNLWRTGLVIEDDFNINLASYIFYQSMNEQLTKITGQKTDIRQRSILMLNPDVLPSGSTQLKGIAPGQVTAVADTAAMVIRGLCEQNADIVYEELSGESKCFELMSGTDGPTPPPGGGDDIWIPEF